MLGYESHRIKIIPFNDFSLISDVEILIEDSSRWRQGFDIRLKQKGN
jgi:hypothetical protein